MYKTNHFKGRVTELRAGEEERPARSLPLQRQRGEKTEGEGERETGVIARLRTHQHKAHDGRVGVLKRVDLGLGRTLSPGFHKLP